MSPSVCDWSIFFPPGTRVVALPDWQRPRLYVGAHGNLPRREQVSLYPASRPVTRLYRRWLKLRIAFGMAHSRTSGSRNWPLGTFLRGATPRPASVVVLLGTPGPVQQATVRLLDEEGETLGYVRYAEKAAARKRLSQEWSMLRAIPEGIGPRPLKFGTLDEGDALLKSALPGTLLFPASVPPQDLTGLLGSLVGDEPVPLEDHPWICRLREDGPPDLDAWLEPLAHRDWPVAVQHGDLVSWNVLRAPDGTLGLLDWEYGTMEGFPYLDLAYYVLQTGALIYREDPTKVARRATDLLRLQPGIGEQEATALTRLTAYDAFRKTLEDGRTADTPLQAWRRAIFEGKSARYQGPTKAWLFGEGAIGQRRTVH